MARRERSKSSTPSSASSCFIWMLSGGCAIFSRPAARVKLSSSATATKYRSCLISTVEAESYHSDIVHQGSDIGHTKSRRGESRWAGAAAGPQKGGREKVGRLAIDAGRQPVVVQEARSANAGPQTRLPRPLLLPSLRCWPGLRTTG